MQKTKIGICFIRCQAHLFMPPEGFSLDPYAGTKPAAILALATNRYYSFIERDDACFHIPLIRVAWLAK